MFSPVTDDKLSVGHSDPVVMSANDPNHPGIRHLTYTHTHMRTIYINNTAGKYTGTFLRVRVFFFFMCVPPGTLSSVLALPRIPEFPRFGGMVLLRLTGALSIGTTLPPMNCDPATL